MSEDRGGCFAALAVSAIILFCSYRLYRIGVEDGLRDANGLSGGTLIGYDDDRAYAVVGGQFKWLMPAPVAETKAQR